MKGGKPRVIPMSPWVFQFLQNKPRASEHVFAKRNGLPYAGASISRRFKRYVRRAGLNELIHFHSIRHTGISWLINQGVPAPFVQKIAGPSSLAVTAGYTHVEDRNLISAVNAFDNISTN